MEKRKEVKRDRQMWRRRKEGEMGERIERNGGRNNWTNGWRQKRNLKRDEMKWCGLNW